MSDNILDQYQWAVAAAETDCPEHPPRRIGDPLIPSNWEAKCCGGTGKVPLFPTLREPCWCTAYPAFGPTCDHGEATDCHGLGWVPVRDLAVLLDALPLAGYMVALTSYDYRPYYNMTVKTFREDRWCVISDNSADISALAAWQAVYHAVGPLVPERFRVRAETHQVADPLQVFGASEPQQPAHPGDPVRG